MACSNIELCMGGPKQFTIYLDYVMDLKFTEDPNFDFMKQLVRDAANEANLDIFDNVYDWSLLLSRRDSQINPLAHRVSRKWWSRLSGAVVGSVPDDEDGSLFERARNFRFVDHESVKAVIIFAHKSYICEAKKKKQENRLEEEKKNDKAPNQNQKILIEE